MQQEQATQEAGTQSSGELSDYQREEIRKEAHEIWLKRQESGQPGDPVSDWQTAESHYFEKE